HWISNLLKKLPNEIAIASSEPADIGWWGDASSMFGIGVVVGPFWAMWAYASGIHVGPCQQYDIGWAEALAVELGLLVTQHHGLTVAIQERSRHAI
ncbi:hypothetical protein C8Q73DRAFT_635081, partial [Cubamyces lactineus]